MAKLIREGKIKEQVAEERVGEFEGTCEKCDAVFSFVISEIRFGYSVDYIYVTCPFCKQDTNVAYLRAESAIFQERVIETIMGIQAIRGVW